MVRFAHLFFMMLMCANSGSVFAQTEDELNRAARDIFETVLSPYCPGRTISNCPSPQADDLRTTIKQQLASGESPEEVKEQLYAAFGDELRTIPRARGFALLAWVVPGIAFLLGGWAIFAWMRRMKAGGRASCERDTAPLDPETDARIEAEMAELDSMQ